MSDSMGLNEAAPPEDQKPDAPTERPKGIFQLPEDEMVKRLRVWLREAVDHHSKRRQAREEEWAALANDQWKDADLTRMAAQKRTTLTLNLLETMLAAVEGEERSNRQELKFYGEEEGDDHGAAAWNRLLKWVMDQCGGEFSLSGQFRHGAAVGEGWIVPEIDFLEHPEGKLKLTHVDEDEMWADPLSVDPTAADARYLHRGRMIEEDEIEARWPGKLADLQQKMLEMEPGQETDGKGFPDIYLTPDKLNGPKVYDGKQKQWLVVESWWTQIEPGFVVANEATGQLDEHTPEEFESLKGAREEEQRQHLMAASTGLLQPIPGDPLTGTPPSMPPMPPPLQAKPRPIRRFYQAFFCGDVLLERRACDIRNLRRYPYVRFGARYDKKKKTWYGLLFLALDIQRQHNVEQSAIIQLIQQMPHASWMGPKGSFHNKNEWENRLAQPGRLFEYNAQRGKPEQITTPAIPRHLVDLAMSRPMQLREITGINTEMTGQRQAGDAGVVMEMRKKAASTVLAPLFDNYRRAKLETGKVLLCYMQTYLPVGIKKRVLGAEKAGWVEITEEMTMGRFDLKVEETNATINDRMETLTVLQTTLPMLLKEGIPLPPETVDLLPMNPAIRDEMKRMIAWHLTVNGMMPPPDWQPGMGLPPPALPAPGAVPPADPVPPQA